MTERPQFVRLFDNPKTHKSSIFIAFYLENDKKTSRIGITLKGRVSGIWRTRLKRVVREWFRTRKSAFEKPVDLNIVIRIPSELDWEYIEKLRKSLTDWKK